MKYIICFILLACLISYFVVIVWLQSLQPHVPTLAAAAPPLWQSVPEKIHILLFIPPLAQSHVLWPPEKLVSQPPLPFCSNPCLSKLSLQSYSLPAGRVLFLALSALRCLHWGGGSQTGWVLPDVLLRSQAARSRGSVQQLSCLAARWRQTLLWSCLFPHFREEALHAWKTVPCFLLDIAVEMAPAPLFGNP